MAEDVAWLLWDLIEMLHTLLVIVWILDKADMPDMMAQILDRAWMSDSSQI